MKLIVCAALVALLIGPAEAQQFVFIGQGGLSCGSWTDFRRDRRELGPEEWVLGFLTGVGAALTPKYDPLKGMDGYGVVAWIDNYCQAHPIDRIMNAAQAFVRAHPR